MIPPLHERMSRLIEFGHSRDEDPLDDTVIASRVQSQLGRPVAEEHIRRLREGQCSDLDADLAQAIAGIFGLNDVGYLLAAPECASEIEVVAIQEMHDRLELLIAARDLGVQHIATRDVDQDPQLIQKLRAALAAMTKDQT